MSSIFSNILVVLLCISCYFNYLAYFNHNYDAIQPRPTITPTFTYTHTPIPTSRTPIPTKEPEFSCGDGHPKFLTNIKRVGKEKYCEATINVAIYTKFKVFEILTKEIFDECELSNFRVNYGSIKLLHFSFDSYSKSNSIDISKYVAVWEVLSLEPDRLPVTTFPNTNIERGAIAILRSSNKNEYNENWPLPQSQNKMWKMLYTESKGIGKWNKDWKYFSFAFKNICNDLKSTVFRVLQ